MAGVAPRSRRRCTLTTTWFKRCQGQAIGAGGLDEMTLFDGQGRRSYLSRAQEAALSTRLSGTADARQGRDGDLGDDLHSFGLSEAAASLGLRIQAPGKPAGPASGATHRRYQARQDGLRARQTAGCGKARIDAPSRTQAGAGQARLSSTIRTFPTTAPLAPGSHNLKKAELRTVCKNIHNDTQLWIKPIRRPIPAGCLRMS